MSSPSTKYTRILRRRSEDKLALSGATNWETLTPVDIQRLLHELQVQQIELKMQNEELRQAIAERDQKDALLETYRDLYEFAPVGYFTIDPDGVIHAVNLSGTVLLGVERSQLINNRFDTFISEETQPAFYDFLKKVFTSNVKEVGEVVFETEHHSPIHVQIDAVVTESRKSCRAVIIDITAHKQGEKELVEAKLRLEAMMAAVPIGISYSDDITCQRVTGNPTVLEQFNISTEDNLSASALDSDAPGRKVKFFLDGREITDAELPLQRAVLENKEIPPIELKVVMPSGKHWIVKASGAPVRNAQGKVIGGIAVTEDITHRKQAEEALRQQSLEAQRLSEHEFHSLAEAMPQIVWATLPDGSNIYFNQQWVEYTGLTMEESYGHGWNIPFHPDDQQRAWDAWTRATQNNERYSLECRLRRADGVYRWWLIRGEPMRGANGDILKWFGTCTDIEDLKSAEAVLHEANERLEQSVTERTTELFESEHQFRVLIQNLHSGVALVNESGEFMIVNRVFLRLFELNDDLNVKNVNDCDWSQWQVFDEYGSLLDVDEHPVRQAALTGRPVQDKLVAVKAPENPEIKWLLVSAEPILDANGRIHRLICTYYDFTDRKLAENELRESEERLRSLADSIPNLAWWANSDGYITWYNRRWYEYTGTTPEQMEGWGWQSVHDPDELPKVLERWQASIATGEPFEMTFPLRGNDGVFRLFLTRILPFKDAAGHVQQWFGTNTDVNELELRVAERTKELTATISHLQHEILAREIAQESLRQETSIRLQATEALREKERLLILQSRHAAMGEMIGNIAHQWRQPLNTLGLYVQSFGAFYGTPNFNKEFVDNSIVKSMEIIKHMSKTIDDFRDYFKPEKEKTDFYVIEAIKSILSLLEGNFQHPKITVDLVAHNNPVINGYRNEFTQVILNILNNARDAIIERKIADARVIITIGSESSCVVVTVADNAGGIPDKDIDKIFDPYFTTKGPQIGTGIGLFMSKTIIAKNMGGRLSVRNTESGAEFRIEVEHGAQN